MNSSLSDRTKNSCGCCFVSKVKEKVSEASVYQPSFAQVPKASSSLTKLVLNLKISFACSSPYLISRF